MLPTMRQDKIAPTDMPILMIGRTAALAAALSTLLFAISLVVGISFAPTWAPSLPTACASCLRQA